MMIRLWITCKGESLEYLLKTLVMVLGGFVHQFRIFTDGFPDPEVLLDQYIETSDQIDI
jgi:hypothetical protein